MPFGVREGGIFQAPSGAEVRRGSVPRPRVPGRGCALRCAAGLLPRPPLSARSARSPGAAAALRAAPRLCPARLARLRVAELSPAGSPSRPGAKSRRWEKAARVLPVLGPGVAPRTPERRAGRRGGIPLRSGAAERRVPGGERRSAAAGAAWGRGSGTGEGTGPSEWLRLPRRCGTERLPGREMLAKLRIHLSRLRAARAAAAGLAVGDAPGSEGLLTSFCNKDNFPLRKALPQPGALVPFPHAVQPTALLAIRSWKRPCGAAAELWALPARTSGAQPAAIPDQNPPQRVMVMSKGDFPCMRTYQDEQLGAHAQH